MKTATFIASGLCMGSLALAAPRPQIQQRNVSLQYPKEMVYKRPQDYSSYSTTRSSGGHKYGQYDTEYDGKKYKYVDVISPNFLATFNQQNNTLEAAKDILIKLDTKDPRDPLETSTLASFTVPDQFKDKFCSLELIAQDRHDKIEGDQALTAYFSFALNLEGYVALLGEGNVRGPIITDAVFDKDIGAFVALDPTNASPMSGAVPCSQIIALQELFGEFIVEAGAFPFDLNKDKHIFTKAKINQDFQKHDGINGFQIFVFSPY